MSFNLAGPPPAYTTQTVLGINFDLTVTTLVTVLFANFTTTIPNTRIFVTASLCGTFASAPSGTETVDFSVSVDGEAAPVPAQCFGVGSAQMNNAGITFVKTIPSIGLHSIALNAQKNVITTPNFQIHPATLPNEEFAVLLVY